MTPQPPALKPGNPSPGNPNAAVQPATEVLGVVLTQDATLPRTGGTTTQPLALAGGVGLGLGLAIFSWHPARQQPKATHPVVRLRGGPLRCPLLRHEVFRAGSC